MEAFRPADGPLPLLRPPQEPFLSLFTGGSTGKPRMWQKTAANLLGEAIHLANTFSVDVGDLILSTAPPQHIYGLLGSVLLPFVSGAAVLRRTCAFPREITAALEDEKPTILVSVPIHYRALKNSALSSHCLRLALSSAAPLESEDGEFFLARTGLRITELYGSTETGGMATRRFGMDNGLWEPFACLDWKIHSDRLCVRSPFVSPDLSRDAEGFYVTADRVAAAEGNRFMFLGRSDRIVKIGGKRVDLDEIREKIRRIPGVSDAYVAAAPGKGTGRLEIAALVAGVGPARTLAAAIRSLEIPYGRPRRVRIVKSIPVCGNGKIDREAIEKLLFSPHRPPASAALREATPPLSPREP
jgi:acyl-coenzyme A synthetase/AMP-(fatty) acid ligase